jgi:predicted AlkP superfamily pyrophosphatase or phosphodiesterase
MKEGDAMSGHAGERRLIYVLVDGMRDDTAALRMGYLEGLVENGQALRARICSVLPSNSRPCYEAIATGTHPGENGIVANHIVRLSNKESIFHRLSKAGKTSAIVAYYWWSELYHRAPFDLVCDCEQADNPDTFTYARFYTTDSFPDIHVFALAERLRLQYDPTFLLIHPMGVDDAGHRYGSQSKEYQASVADIDSLISQYLPTWLEEGYTVIVNADHGMNEFHSHGGTDPVERITPFYLLGRDVKVFGRQSNTLPQTSLARLFCRFLNSDPAPTMHPFPDDVYETWIEE